MGNLIRFGLVPIRIDLLHTLLSFWGVYLYEPMLVFMVLVRNRDHLLPQRRSDLNVCCQVS